MMKNSGFGKKFWRYRGRILLLANMLLLCACAAEGQPVVSASQTTPTASPTPLPASASTAVPPDSQSPSRTPTLDVSLGGAELVEALRQGGYVIYIHTVVSDQSQNNSDDLETCNQQSNLSEQAQNEARAIGESVLALRIPVGQVLHSAACSSRDTAMLAFGHAENWLDLLETPTPLRGERIAALRQILSKRPEPGTNNVFVGHDLDITDVTGVTPAEGEASIYRPLGNPGYSSVARILPKAWEELKQNTSDLVKIEPYASGSSPLEEIIPTDQPNVILQTGPGGQNQVVPPDQPSTTERALLLPDLITLTPTDLRIRTNQADGHKLLRFTNSIMNAGPGGMELWGATNPGSGKMTVTQHIYDTEGSTEQRVVGEFFFHPEHNHWHLGDFARYQIWSIGPGGKLDSVVAVSNKISYCLRDDARSDIPGAATWQTYISCDHERQGISAGWIDIYRYHLPGQSIDITFLPDSVYALQSIVDPESSLWESDSTNNSVILYIAIEGNSVSIIESPDSLKKILEGQDE